MSDLVKSWLAGGLTMALSALSAIVRPPASHDLTKSDIVDTPILVHQPCSDRIVMVNGINAPLGLECINSRLYIAGLIHRDG